MGPVTVKELSTELPGGLRDADGVLRRDFRFRPLTGALELALAEAAAGPASHPERVSRVLAGALESLAGAGPDLERVRQLSVGDRQFLMLALSARVDDTDVWLTGSCSECAEPFDTAYRPSALPVKPAGEGYPAREVTTSCGRVRVRAPTGADQEAIADLGDEQAALERLLARLVQPLGVDPQAMPSAFDADAVSLIEATVEAMVPEVAGELDLRCPHCGADQRVATDPYVVLQRPVGELFAQVHRLAAAYHWSEREILDLPRHRRETYLSLIDRSRGMHSADALPGAS